MKNKKNYILDKSNKKKYIVSKKLKWIKKFNTFFIFSKKITFFKKLKTYFEEYRLLWHCILKNYLPLCTSNVKRYKKKVGHIKFYFFLLKFETRLSTLLLRARFFYKIVDAFNGIKLNLILVNGIIVSKSNFLVNPLDIFQKRRNLNFMKKKIKKISFLKRKISLKWRKYRWKQARFIFWQIRRFSNFNLFLSKKKSSYLNYIEVNYKIPAGILLRLPLINEILLNRRSQLSNLNLWKKIYFIY